MHSSPVPTVAVIGAGMSGLVCARTLQDAGFAVKVFDKSRGVGGRLATRRTDYGSFDHGAQYFTARDPGFQRAVQQWLIQDLIAVWSPRLIAIDADSSPPVHSTVGDSTLRHVGLPAMNRIGKALAEGLDVRLGCTIANASRVNSRWSLTPAHTPDRAQSACVPTDPFDWLVAATPSPQAAALLDQAPGLQAQALALPMVPCWALLARFDSPLPLEYDAAFISGSPLTWIARNNTKPGRSPEECWVLHAARDWSEAELERTPEAMVEPMLTEFRRLTGTRAMPSIAHAHRWRYSGPAARSDSPCLFDTVEKAGACGDWLAGSRVEGAWLSGQALARQIIAAEAGRTG